MYDHQTDSLWHNLTGEPVVGSLAHSGIRLKTLPVVITSWKEWSRKHPDTLVLDINTGFERDYTPGKPYGDYFASPDTMFPVAHRDDRLAAKSYVFSLQLMGRPKAYPLSLLAEKPVVNDTLAGINVVIVANAKTRTVRAYERGDHFFLPGATIDSVDERDSDMTWRVEEEYIINPKSNERLPRLGGHVSYWFGWYAFYPYGEVYQGSHE